jgi:hypothetical protein
VNTLPAFSLLPSVPHLHHSHSQVHQDLCFKTGGWDQNGQQEKVSFCNNPCDVAIPPTYCFFFLPFLSASTAFYFSIIIINEYSLLFSLIFHPTGCTKKWIHKMTQYSEVYRRYSFSAWCSQQYTAHATVTVSINCGSTPYMVTATLTQFSELLTHTSNSLCFVLSVKGRSKNHIPLWPLQK